MWIFAVYFLFISVSLPLDLLDTPQADTVEIITQLLRYNAVLKLHVSLDL
jgi:hypothetical protein